jgi:hypothetical protein
MTFFYNLNKTLDAIREKPETTHGQLNERDMGKHNNAVTGFKAVADKAAKEYGSKAAGERVAGAQFQKMKKAGKLEENAAAGYSPEMQARIKTATPQQLAQMAQELAGGPAQYQSEFTMLQAAQKELQGVQEGFVDAVKSGAQAALGAIGSTMGHGSDEDMIRDLQKKAGLPQTGKVPPQQPGQQPAQPGQQPIAEGEAEDRLLAAKIRKMLPAYHKRMEPEDAYQEVADALGISVERLYDVLELDEGVDKQAFGALAPPKNKITFADKIAGAKKEVDEMLGDVAAEAMKNALSGGQKKLDKNMNGKLDSQDFAMLRKGGKKQVADEGFPTVAGARAELNKRKVGDVTHGAKHDTQEVPGGRRVTRRLDPNTGYSVGSDTDDEGNAKSTEKKGRGRPKKTDKAPERVTAKAYKHKGGRKEKVEEGPDEGNDLVKLSKVIASCKTHEQLLAAQNMANNFLKKHLQRGISNIGKNVSRQSDVNDTLQQKNKDLGGVEEGSHYGNEKLANAKASRSGTTTVRDQDGKGGVKTTTTKTPAKKKEKTDETTVAGSVAPAAGGKSKAGSMVGKGIYDSLNRDLESMISESMNVSVNVSQDEHGEPRKSITINAEGEAAEQLAQLLNLAGMQGQSGEESCGTCGEAACHCDEEMVDENSPDWPTDQETIGNDDPLMRRYAGGVNGPKSTGQTTGSPYNRQDSRQGMMGENKDLGMKLYAELKSFKG